MRLVFSAEKGYSRGGAWGGVGGRNPGGSGADAPGAKEHVEVRTVNDAVAGNYEEVQVFAKS